MFKFIEIKLELFTLNLYEIYRLFSLYEKRPDRSKIKNEWIEVTIKNPVKTEIQSDGRIRKWAKIDSEGKYLRVITLEDGQTVHNAFFDRNFKEE